MKAIVVGGGCAGLTAAHTLHKDGYDVTVYERADQAGGRMSSYKKDGFTVDIAAQLVHPGYKMARKVMEELGILDQLINFDLQGMKIYFNGDWIRPNPAPDDPEEIAKTMAWINYMGEENFKRGEKETGEMRQFITNLSHLLFLFYYLGCKTESFSVASAEARLFIYLNPM